MTGIFRSLSRKNLHNATIWGVYVKPKWRGHQISEALIRSCLGWAKAHGVYIVKLAVATNNLQAVNCYARCGFTTYGTEPKAIYCDGIYYDEYLMAIEVDAAS
jgi:RimJ/RimL family protein N-acetyltransferase